MRITKIPRIRNHGIYRSFDWPAGLPDFSHYNLIYGWNGSGKTTLSNILRAIEKRTPVAEGEVMLEIDGAEVKGSALDTAPVPRVKVFNRAFVEENVFTTSGAVSAILFLGKKNKENQEEIERLKKQLDDQGGLRQQLASVGRTLTAAEQALDKYCITAATKIRDLLRSSGQNPYNNYDKSSYKSRMAALLKLETDEAKNKRLSDTDKDTLKAKKDARQKASITQWTLKFPDLESLRTEVATLLQRSVVSAALQEFENAPAAEAWAKEGLELHRSHAEGSVSYAGTCKFCQNPLSASRVKKLESHFNAEYAALVKTLDDADRLLQSHLDSLQLKDLPSHEQFNEHLVDRYNKVRELLVSEAAAVTAVVSELQQLVQTRKSQPMKIMDLPEKLKQANLAPSEPHKATTQEFLACITTHNQECTNFLQIVRDAREALETAYVADDIDAYNALDQKVRNANDAKKKLTDSISEAANKITALEKEIIEHQTPAEELNAELAKYLGRDEIRFQVEGGGYRILRRDQPAKNLSEGEKTAIAFLYFLKCLQDKGFTLAEDVIVIDDPISSLDANSLFCAFGYMKERTKDAGQLFILTHNFGFFRQVKNWFSHLNGGPRRGQVPNNAKAHYYMLEAVSTAGVRNARLIALDRLLWEYESEYHYLFKRVHGGSQLGPGLPLEDYYPLPNIARRLLEGFFGFRYPTVHGLRDQLNRASGDAALKARILRFAHTYSHETGADEAEHDLTLLGETPVVLADVLDLIRIEDTGHYQEMMQLAA